MLGLLVETWGRCGDVAVLVRACSWWDKVGRLAGLPDALTLCKADPSKAAPILAPEAAVEDPDSLPVFFFLFPAWQHQFTLKQRRK